MAMLLKGIAGYSRCFCALRPHLLALPRASQVHQSFGLGSSTDGKDEKNMSFDPKMLEILACPLSKKPLRYDPENQELICDELSVAYPIIEGIPDLNPHSGRMIKTEDKTDTT